MENQEQFVKRFFFDNNKLDYEQKYYNEPYDNHFQLLHNDNIFTNIYKNFENFINNLLNNNNVYTIKDD